MKVRDAMTRDVEVVQPGASVREAARLMSEVDTGIVPVCDGRRVLGMLTDRDIVIRVVAEGRAIETPVSEVMTSQVEYCFEDDELDEAADKMGRLQMRRLIVLGEDRQLAGILSLGDLAREHDEGETGRALEQISEPGQSH